MRGHAEELQYDVSKNGIDSDIFMVNCIAEQRHETTSNNNQKIIKKYNLVSLCSRSIFRL